MTSRFVLQIVGIKEATILCRPTVRCIAVPQLADVIISHENTVVLAHTPMKGCDGMVDTGTSVFVAYCPPEEYELSIANNGQQFTHTIFLALFKEGLENEQVICINPSVAMEIMESAIEKNLMRLLPPVKQFKRHVPLFLEGKVNSEFSFVGLCDDNTPFIMDVNNVPYAEYNHGMPNAFKKITHINTEYDYNTKSAYFPEKNANTSELIKRIKEMATIAKESTVRCIIAYVVERTDINKFELSVYDPEYRLAVKQAVDCGVNIMTIVVGWTNDGNAIFVTDELPVIKPIFD